jgi:hypothetical protein
MPTTSAQTYSSDSRQLPLPTAVSPAASLPLAPGFASRLNLLVDLLLVMLALGVLGVLRRRRT